MTLDPEKRPIIEADIGETLKTIAGAGTGKTRVLVERYLRFVLDERIPPARLLALTFTKKAASEMRHRIFRDAGERDGPGILRELHSAWIMNFHQFAFRIIKESAALFGMDPGTEVATELDISRIERRLYRRFEAGRIDGLPDDLGDDILAPAKLASVFERWLEAVAKARGTLWTPEGLLAAVRGEDSPAYRAIIRSIAALWTAYEGDLRRRNLIDFSDMLRMAVCGLRDNPALRERYAGKFDHILVDEFQDTNEIQNELLSILSGGDFSRVTVVGDDKQSIYRWRDARVENLRGFAGREHFLRINHRSTQNILDLAHHFIVSDPYFAERAEDIRLQAYRGASDVPICVYHPPDGEERSYENEAKALAAWILSVTGRLDEGASPFACYRGARVPLDYGDIAVLMRKLKGSAALREYERVFRDVGIPYAVSGGGGSIEVRAFERLRDLLRVVVYPDDVQALLGLLETAPFLLPDGSLHSLFGAASGLDVDALLSDRAVGALTDPAAQASCVRLRALVDDLRERRLLELPAFVSRALEAGPFYYALFDDGADEKLVESALKTIVEIVDRLVLRGEGNVAAFIEALEVLIASKALDEGASTLPAGRVRIMTVHAAKGLQFPAVAVPGLQQQRDRSEGCHLSRSGGLYLSDAKEWGRGVADADTYEAERADLEQEERCLLYVAFTRAQDHLFVSSPCADGAGRGKTEGLFGVVLGALKKNAIPHEELRRAPNITRTGARGERDAGERGPGENWKALVGEWWTERERLRAAESAPQPVREIEFVSWRRLHTFAQCPAMYHYRYVAGMEHLADADEEADPRGAEREAEERDDFTGELRLPRGVDPKTLGLFVHRLLFEWMSPGASSGGNPEDAVDDLIRRFGANVSQRDFFRRQGVELLRTLAESGLADRAENDGLEVSVAARRERTIFRGTIDRIDRAADGVRIIDYKGKERDEYAYQVRFYAWILRMSGRTVSNEATLCCLAPPPRVVRVDVSPGSLEDIDSAARRLEEAAGSGIYRASPGAVCEACAFSVICPSSSSVHLSSR